MAFSDNLQKENGTAMNKLTPDADSVKLFVGHIPRELKEDDIRRMFEVFGPVFSVFVLKDKVTQESRGSCFLQFYKRQAALDAQNEWHGKKTMPGLKHPMQVKTANSEIKSEEERRLFVGMLSRSTTQDELVALFSPFGALDDCVILIDSDGNSKGCAFVTFTTQLSAMNAIKALHLSRTFEGCKSPIVVKFAETQQQKEMKRQHSTPQRPTLPANGGSYNNMMSPPPAMGAPRLPFNFGAPPRFPPFGAPPVNPYSTRAPTASGPFSSPPPVPGLDSQSLQGIQALAQLASNPVLSTLLNPTIVQQFAAAAAAFGNSAAAQPSLPTNPPGPYPYPGSNVPPPMNYPAAPRAPPPGPAGRDKEGPAGCNLFIFNVPPTYTDAELYNMFSPFGNIVSATIFVDKVTKLSKGYGFVSYDNKMSANNAIKSMNGFRIGMGKLKVQLKTPKGSKPY